MDAVPDPDPTKPPPRLTLHGEIATPINPPDGCRLCKRCPIATPNCESDPPPLKEKAAGHFVACHNI